MRIHDKKKICNARLAFIRVSDTFAVDMVRNSVLTRFRSPPTTMVLLAFRICDFVREGESSGGAPSGGSLDFGWGWFVCGGVRIEIVKVKIVCHA